MSKPSLPKELQGLLRQNSTLAPLAKAARGRKAAAPKGPAAPPQDCLPPALRDRVTVVADASVEDTASELRVTVGGRVIEAAHDVLGDSDPEVIAPRLREKSATLLGDKASAMLWKEVAQIDRRGGLAALAGRLASNPAQQPVAAR